MADLELLFFDTFSHETSEEINLDLVQFTKPVYIGEVRIIPLGARVQADFPGGVRLGATNPSQFKIEFFVNDLSKPGASTFENLGAIDYNQNGNIHLECDRRHIPTDGLVLRGWYTTITLAVYGVLTKAIPAEVASGSAGHNLPISDPRPPPPDMPANMSGNEWVQHGQDEADHGYLVEGPHYTSYPPESQVYSSQEYQRHSFQWQHPQACHSDSYDSSKEPYETDGSWDIRSEDKRWDRSKDRRQTDLSYRYDRNRHADQSPDYHERGTPEYDGGHRGRHDYYGSSNNQWEGSWPTSPSSKKRPHTPPSLPQNRTPPPPSRRSPHKVSDKMRRDDRSPDAPFESLSPGDVESISEGDIPETEVNDDGRKTPDKDGHSVRSVPARSPSHDDKSLDAEQFEPILSDDDIVDDTEHQDLDYEDYSEDPLKSFNPYNCNIQPLKHLMDPALSPCGLNIRKSPECNEKEESFETLLNKIDNPSTEKELWVTVAEKVICHIANVNQTNSEEKDGIINKLISWVDYGLNFNEAFNQPQPAMKLRHIKVGVRLVEVLCQYGEEVTEKMITETDAQTRLILLYHKEYMALSIKLMILKSLDMTLRYKPCIEKFLHSKFPEEVNSYQKLLEMIEGNQLARVKYALCSLMHKIHFYEALTSLSSSVKELENEMNGSKMEGCEEHTSCDLEFVSTCLEGIVDTFIDAPNLISQPKRFLPVSAQFEITHTSSSDIYKVLYSYFRVSNIIDCCILLLSHPVSSNNLSIITPVNNLIAEFLETDEGLRFLGNSPNVNKLLRILLGGSGNRDENEVGGPGINPTLGLHSAFRLQALNYIDTLMGFESSVDPDKTEVLDILQGMFYLTLSNIGNIGKISVANVLSQADNIQVILNFMKHKSITRKRSPARGYICDLITLVIRHSTSMPFLLKFYDQLSNLCKEFPELSDIGKWLTPIANQSSFSYDDISHICSFINNNIDNATSLPGEMITAVRLLKYLGIPKHEEDMSQMPLTCEYQELKYKWVLLQVFSQDTFSMLCSILQKLCEHYTQPCLHSAQLVGRQGLILLSFILPAIQIIRRVLTYVIRCRNTDFKDLTAIPMLLQTYNLMQAFPNNAQAHTDSLRVCREIVETLLAFTQPVSSDLSTETEALNKSLWTSMVSSVIQFAIAAPLNFMSGLMIFSEILPLPLPLQTKKQLDVDEISKVANSRKLWSAHLLSLSPMLEELIGVMSVSSHQPLLQLLRRVCIQLADLSAPTALVVTKTLLESLCVHISAQPNTSHLMRLLNFLACLVTHSPVKAALISLLIKGTPKSDDRYSNLLKECANLFRTNFDSAAHSQSQEYLASIFQSLIDVEISLVPPPGVSVPSRITLTTELFLSNSLPPKDILNVLISSIADHTEHPEHGLNTQLSVIRCFLMLLEHDFGFYHLKVYLDKKPESLLNILKAVASNWDKSTHLCLTTLSACLEFARACTNAGRDDGYPMRNLCLSQYEVSQIFSWTTEGDHPLKTIMDNLKKTVTEDETYEPLLENVTVIVKLLEEGAAEVCDPKEYLEPVLPAPEPLLAQFSLRPIHIVVEGDDDRLSASYWLSPPSMDDQDNDVEQVTIDLIDITKSDLTDMCLDDAIAQVCAHKSGPCDLDPTSTTNKKRLIEPNTKRPFIAPMRGRGFRGGGVQRGDMFRSRPPNTSRPPSLHVDDFVALETCGAQPTGPTGYNKLSMRAAQDLIVTRNRGRGRTFGIDRGGRFFGSTNYHREVGVESVWDSQTQFTYTELMGADTSGKFCGRNSRSNATWLVKESRGNRGGHRDSTRQMRFFTR